MYQKVITSNGIELCSIYNGTSSNALFSSLVVIFEASLPPGMIHSCPYFGKIQLNNLTIDTSKIPSIFPTGSYRNRVLFYDDKDPKIFAITTYSTCKSPIKTSF